MDDELMTILHILLKVSIRSHLFPGRSERKFWWESEIRRKKVEDRIAHR